MVLPKTDFAHYMPVDIQVAQDAAIDGFALNIGANDSFSTTALRNAYGAAAELGNFSVFLSFDFAAAGNWTVDNIANLTSTFKDEPAQFKVDSKPLVGTFEGASFANDWKWVRSKVDGGIFLVPDWSIQGPKDINRTVRDINGAFSWSAWPQPGKLRMTTDANKQYQKSLNGEAYIMGVSPYFYTRVPELDKNWYASSDRLWFDRWRQVIDIMPDMVQIISFNDFAESHCLADIRPQQVIAEALPYVSGMSHAGFRAILPYFIAAYKAGREEVAFPKSMGAGTAIAYYRTTPVNISKCADGGTVWGQHGNMSARAGVIDAINVIAVSAQNTSLTVSLGRASQTLDIAAGPPQYFQVPFDDLNYETGNLIISMGGETAHGPPITKTCPASNDVVR
ncbi:glycoside hydrolase [Lasiosphaeria miniovina]|uniref:Glycoside hydrolase n=1 Tax=Lasiosphaeria miniovina TaxID=1954250 RepID=A0AA40DVR3_9PEZI|nr:glycoside hydrolase [Lasiosphaeria miniovina]KAK0713523.1 glycoside hydrolase [Lasiosphaeria miniovina]